MEFVPSKAFSIGIELELQLLDADSLDLVDGIIPLMEFYPGNPHVKPEFIQNTVELSSRVCGSLAELEAHMDTLVEDLKLTSGALNMHLCGAGSHPFSERLALITPLPRYLLLEKVSGYLGYTQITFATHVHVGLGSGDQAIAVMRDLTAYLPVLIAVSANSPFWRGYDTGYVCYRHRILAATRSYGIPPVFDSWQAFSEFADVTRRVGVFESINDIHWDLRPRPHLGTLEVRVMDAQSTVAEALVLAGLVRFLVHYLVRTPRPERPPALPAPLPWWLEKENHFQASRRGMKAQYIASRDGRVRPMREVVQNVLDVLEQSAQALGEGDYLERLRAHCETGPGYARQRRRFEQTRSLREVVEELVALL